MQHRKSSDGAGPEHPEDYCPDRMKQSGQTCRYQRMHRAQRPEFHETRRNLRRSDQSGGRYRRRRAGAGDFEEMRQVRRHGTRYKPRRCKHESKDARPVVTPARLQP
jgi:hypothetical protein